MPPICRSERLLDRIQQETADTNPLSDGTVAITGGEARSAARALLRSSFDTTENRRAVIAHLLASPGSFESLAVYDQFAASVTAGRWVNTPGASNLQVIGESGDYEWPVTVRVDGEEVEVGEAISATAERPDVRIIDNRYVCYPVAGRLGGDENHGMALAVFDVVTRTTRIVAEEYYPIHSLTTVRAPGGRTYLIMGMTDQSDFGERAAIVDVARGEVASFAGSARRVAAGIATRTYDDAGVITRETLSWDALADMPVIANEPGEDSPNGALDISATIASFNAGGWRAMEVTSVPEAAIPIVEANLEAEEAYFTANPDGDGAMTCYTATMTDAYDNTYEVFALETVLGESRTVTFFGPEGIVLASQSGMSLPIRTTL